MDERNTDALARQLGDIYHPLELKAFQLCQGLQHRIFDPRRSYYSGHSHISSDGFRRIDWFPLPVVTLDGLCDVVVDLDRVVVDTKLRRGGASSLPFEQFEKYEITFVAQMVTSSITIRSMRISLRRGRRPSPA